MTTPPLPGHFETPAELRTHLDERSENGSTGWVRNWARKRIRIYERDGWCCVLCGSTRYLTIDHKVPRSAGGSRAYENLQAMCYECNHSKGSDGKGKKGKKKHRVPDGTAPDLATADRMLVWSPRGNRWIRPWEG